MTYKREGPLDPHGYDPFLPRLLATLTLGSTALAMVAYQQWPAVALCVLTLAGLWRLADIDA